MRKILHIIESLAVGGAEKLLTAVINGLDNYEHHVIILEEPESLRSELKPYHRFLNLRVSSKADFLRASGKVKRYIKENNIDIVHGHLYRANILSRLATPKKIKLFNSIHAISSLAAYQESKLALYIEKVTYRKRNHIIAVSKEVLDDFKKHVGIKGKADVLYNFIDESFFAPQPKTRFSEKGLKLVAVGNLRYQKNYPYIMEAFKNMPVDVSLDIYGEGPMRAELQEKIDKDKLNIRLCGLHGQIHTVLPQYDAFLMSSFYEGQPLSLLEAMASGLPSFLADIPVLREVTGEQAIYFDINDPASLPKKVREVLDNKSRLAQIATASHKRVNEFAHAKQYLEKLTGLYEESLLRGKS